MNDERGGKQTQRCLERGWSGWGDSLVAVGCEKDRAFLSIHLPLIFFHHSPAPRRRSRRTHKTEQRFSSKSFLNTILPRPSSTQPSSSQPPFLPPASQPPSYPQPASPSAISPSTFLRPLSSHHDLPSAIFSFTSLPHPIHKPFAPQLSTRGKASHFPTMAFCLTKISRSTRASRAKEVSRALRSPSATSVSTANEAPGASKANRLAKTSRPTREKKDGTYYPTSTRTVVVPG